MDKVLLKQQHLTDIADAIRRKNGGSNHYKPREMAAAITSLPSSSCILESLNVTANGIYTPEPSVNGFDCVKVAVPTGKSTFAFAVVTNIPGLLTTATDGVTTLTGDDSGSFVFALPNGGHWTFLSNGTERLTTSFPTFGESRRFALNIFSVDQDYSFNNNLILDYAPEEKVLTASWVVLENRNSGFVFHIDNQYQKVRITTSGSGSRQFGTCSSSATLPGTVSSGSGRGSYRSGGAAEFTVSSSYPRLFCSAWGMSVGQEVTYVIEIVE